MLKTRLKLITIIASFLVIAATLGYFLALNLQQQVNSYMFNLATTISEEIGHPVTIDSASTNWSWGCLQIHVEGVRVTDNDTQTPIFVADSITARIKTFQSLLKLAPQFGKVTLVSPRMVLDWDGDGVPTVLGLSGEKVPGVIEPRVLLRILDMQSHISIVDGDFHLQGLDTADLPFMRVRMDFRNKGNNTYSLIARGAIAAPNPPEFTFAVNYQGDLSDYRLAVVDFELKTSSLNMTDILKFIPGYDKNLISGNFHDFDLKGNIQDGIASFIQGDLSIDQFGIKEASLKNGKGHIEYHSHNDRLSIEATDVHLSSGDLFNNDLLVQKISGDIHNTVLDGIWHISSDNLKVHTDGMTIRPHLKAKLLEQSLQSLELECELDQGKVFKLLNLLPDKLIAPSFYSWLKDALVAGDVTNVNLNYTPEHVNLSMDFVDAELNYAGDWPSITDLSARLTINDDQLLITADNAKIFGQALKELTTEFVITPRPFKPVIIKGKLDSNLGAGMEFLQHTPLKETLADKLATFNPQGNMHLALLLTVLPSKENDKVSVEGELNLQRAKISLPDVSIPLRNITGKMHFTKNSMHANNLKLDIFKQHAVADLKMVGDDKNELQIDFSTPLQIKDLHKALPFLANFKLDGMTNIRGRVNIPWTDESAGQVIEISTDMEGIGIDYPFPLQKEQTDTMPLRLAYHVNSSPINMVNIDLVDIVSASIFIHEKEFYGANITFGGDTSARSVVDSISITGTLQEFDWEKWQPLLQDNNNYAVIPLQFDLDINRIKLDGNEYANNKIRYDSAKRSWEISNDIVEGRLLFADDNEKVDVILKRLAIDVSSEKLEHNLDYFKNKQKDNSLPMVEFSCEQLKFNNQVYRNVSLNLLPRTYGYEMHDISLESDNMLLQAQGQWQMDPDSEFTQLSGNAYTKNFGKIMREWQFGNSITRGAGELNFTVQWPGDPFDFSYLKLNGASHFDLRSGTLTEVKPGLGRVIGLLNIDSIQRRLQLDFSDITDRGLSFDKFEADIKFEPGTIESNNVMINSPSARIELDGNLDLESQRLDFTMYVTPKMGASIPVAAAIAVNPAVGAALWLFDKAAGSKISEISKYKYQVTGTWDNPQIDEVITESNVSAKASS